MNRRSIVVVTASLTAVVAVSGATATGMPSAAKQRIAISIKLPLAGGTGTYLVEPLTSGPVKLEVGRVVFTKGPTPVFSGRIIGGQSVDRFRAVDTLKGPNGTFALRLQVDFVSAGNGYQVGTGTWAISSGTGAYAGVSGGGRSALARPPSPPARFGFARHEGFVTKG